MSRPVPTARNPRLLRWPELLEAANQPHEWIVENLIPKGAVTIVAGPPNAGKTRLMNTLVAARSAGSEIAGLKVTPGANLILALEHSPRQVAFGLTSAAAGLGLAELKVSVVRPPFDLLDESHAALLDEWLRETGANLLVIDSLRRIAGFDENNSQEVAPILEMFRTVADRGISVVLIHHPAKNGTGPRGSGDLKAGTESIVTVTKVAGSDLVSIHAEHHDAEEFSITIRFVHQENLLKVARSEQLVSHREANLRDAIVSVLRAAGKPLGTTDVRTAIRSARGHYQNDEITRMLNTLQQEGQVIDLTPEGRRRSYTLPIRREAGEEEVEP